MKLIKSLIRNVSKINIITKNRSNIYTCFKSNNKANLSKPIRFQFCEKVDKDGFPLPNENDYDDPDDLFINIGPPEKFKGMLVICPTPIGNLNDLTVRQLEALKNGDILACEDTRKTGKLIEHIKQKKMKDKFQDEFGLSFDEFINKGGLDMNDEQIEKTFNLKDIKEKNSEENEKSNFSEFYKTKSDIIENKKFEEKQKHSEGKFTFNSREKIGKS